MPTYASGSLISALLVVFVRLRIVWLDRDNPQYDPFRDSVKWTDSLCHCSRGRVPVRADTEMAEQYYTLGAATPRMMQTSSPTLCHMTPQCIWPTRPNDAAPSYSRDLVSTEFAEACSGFLSCHAPQLSSRPP